MHYHAPQLPTGRGARCGRSLYPRQEWWHLNLHLTIGPRCRHSRIAGRCTSSPTSAARRLPAQPAAFAHFCSFPFVHPVKFPIPLTFLPLAIANREIQRCRDHPGKYTVQSITMATLRAAACSCLLVLASLSGTTTALPSKGLDSSPDADTYDFVSF